MQLEKIQQFRTSLRKFERDVSIGQKKDARTGGLTVVQCHTVINLGTLGETTIGQMAVQMCVDKSTLSRTVDNLVKLKLVNRKPFPDDRRYFLISLTSKGQEACDKLNQVNDEYLQSVFSKIPKNEHTKVMKYFNMFVNALLESDGDNISAMANK